MQFERKVGYGFFVEQDITQRVEIKGNLLKHLSDRLLLYNCCMRKTCKSEKITGWLKDKWYKIVPYTIKVPWPRGALTNL